MPFTRTQVSISKFQILSSLRSWRLGGFNFCVLLVLFCSTLRAEIRLYVSADGRNGWTGSQPGRAGDGKNGPLPSIQAARDLIRTRRAAGQWQKEAITISIAPGTYFLAEPLELGPQDGGAEG